MSNNKNTFLSTHSKPMVEIIWWHKANHDSVLSSLNCLVCIPDYRDHPHWTDVFTPNFFIRFIYIILPVHRYNLRPKHFYGNNSVPIKRLVLCWYANIFIRLFYPCSLNAYIVNWPYRSRSPNSKHKQVDIYEAYMNLPLIPSSFFMMQIPYDYNPPSIPPLRIWQLQQSR